MDSIDLKALHAIRLSLVAICNSNSVPGHDGYLRNAGNALHLLNTVLERYPVRGKAGDPVLASDSEPASKSERAATSPETLELLAANEHLRWAAQALTALHGMTEERRGRWERLATTPYAELTEDMKELDRMQVREYLAIMNGPSASEPEEHTCETCRWGRFGVDCSCHPRRGDYSGWRAPVTSGDETAYGYLRQVKKHEPAESDGKGEA